MKTTCPRKFWFGLYSSNQTPFFETLSFFRHYLCRRIRLFLLLLYNLLFTTFIYPGVHCILCLVFLKKTTSESHSVLETNGLKNKKLVDHKLPYYTKKLYKKTTTCTFTGIPNILKLVTMHFEVPQT